MFSRSSIVSNATVELSECERYSSMLILRHWHPTRMALRESSPAVNCQRPQPTFSRSKGRPRLDVLHIIARSHPVVAVSRKRLNASGAASHKYDSMLKLETSDHDAAPHVSIRAISTCFPWNRYSFLCSQRATPCSVTFEPSTHPFYITVLVLGHKTYHSTLLSPCLAQAISPCGLCLGICL